MCPKNHNWSEPDIENEKDEYRSFGRNTAPSGSPRGGEWQQATKLKINTDK